MALNWNARTIMLKTGDSSTKVTFKDLGAKPDYLASVKAARRPLWSMARNVISTHRTFRSFNFVPAGGRFGRAIRTGSRRRAPAFLRKRDEVEVCAGNGGVVAGLRRVHKPLLIRRRPAFASRRNGNTCVIVAPAVGTADLESMLPFEKVAEFKTNYAPGNDRAYNIELCSSLLSEVEVGMARRFRLTGSPDREAKKWDTARPRLSWGTKCWTTTAAAFAKSRRQCTWRC